MSQKFIPFTVVGWNKHNPQKKSGSWFKISHHIFDNPKVADLNAKEFKLYIILLTLCSKSCNQTSLLNSIHCRIECKMRSHAQLFQALTNLERNGLVSLDKSREDKRREDENKTKKQNTDASGSADARTEKPPKQKRRRKKREPEEVSQARRDDAAACIALYCTLFKNKYGTNPILGGKEAGIFKTLVTAHGQKKILELLEIYFVINNKYFQSRTHDVGVFSQNLNQLVICASSNDPNNTVLNAPIDPWEELN